MLIPDKLKKQYFVKVLKGTKKAFETGWQNKRIKYSEIQAWVRCGNNYGVLCGVDGLVVVDFDSMKFHEDQAWVFPDTFEVKTGSGKFHKYYYCHDWDGNAEIKEAQTGEHCGEVRFNRMQVIAPGSVHPETGNQYVVYKDVEIQEISAKELISLFGQYELIFSKTKDNDAEVPNCETGIAPILNKITGLINKGDEWQGAHPIHGSSTGSNFAINTQKNTWYCFRHGVGGNAIHLAAVMSGLCNCEDVHKLRGVKYKQAVDLAKIEYGIETKEREKEESLELAEKFLEKNTLVFSEENGAFYLYDNGYYRGISEIDLNKMFLEMEGWEKLSIHKISDITKRIKVLVGKHLDDFNKELCLNLNNGIYDIDKDELTIHNADLLSTIRLPYNYDRDAKCPLWLEFLKQSLGSDDRINTLQEFMGYCLTKDTRFEMALCMTSEGRSGKGVITHVLHELIGGENISNLGLEHFGDTQMLKILVNKMVNISEEVRENAVNFDAEFKKVVSGERISVNQKYVDVYEFRPFCKLILNINTFPRITDKSRAFYERILVIPFDRTFEIEERDSTLKERLVREELAGILNWVLDGQRRLYKRGHFIMTKEMQNFIKNLKKTNNPVELFIDEEIKVCPGSYETRDNLYTIYNKWCVENGNKPLSRENLCKHIYKYLKLTPTENDRETTGERKRFISGVKIGFNQNKKDDLTWEE